MNKRVRLSVVLALFVMTAGCGSSSNDGPFGPATESALLSPIAGDWVFDFERTIDALKTAGMSDKEVEDLRKLYAENPLLGKMHPDMNIAGDVAVCAGFPSSEYRFFSMREHDGKVCGKAWHHEDRFDPGDMSKCYVRLVLKDNLLFFETRMKDGNPDLNDPDLLSQPSAEGGSAATCDADHPPGTDWSEWTTFVFSRKQ